jgi:hypothetical protein
VSRCCSFRYGLDLLPANLLPIPDSPGRNTGLSRKKYWTLQEEILDSPGRNTGLSRKKYWTLQEEMPDSPGNTF